jgi:adenylate cyclase
MLAADVVAGHPGPGVLRGQGRSLLAVLPVLDLDRHPRDQHLAPDAVCAGLTEDLLIRLARSSTVSVVAVEEEKRAEDLGARYLLRGRVRHAADRSRISARLIQLPTFNHIWTQSYDRQLLGGTEPFGDIANCIADEVEHAVAVMEQRLALGTKPADLGPWGFYQRALWHIRRCTPTDNAQAKLLLEQAIGLDPTFAASCSALAMVRINGGVVYGAEPLETSAGDAARWAQLAVRLDPDDGDAIATLALAELVAGRMQEAWGQVLLALRAAPTSAWARSVSGIVRMYGGEQQQGRADLLAGLRAAPRDPRNAIVMTQVAISHYFEADYRAAATLARQAILRYPEHPIAYRWLAMSLGQMGGGDRAALRDALERQRYTFQRYDLGPPPWMRPSDHAHVMDGIRKSGWRSSAKR